MQPRWNREAWSLLEVWVELAGDCAVNRVTRPDWVDIVLSLFLLSHHTTSSAQQHTYGTRRCARRGLWILAALASSNHTAHHLGPAVVHPHPPISGQTRLASPLRLSHLGASISPLPFSLPDPRPSTPPHRVLSSMSSRASDMAQQGFTVKSAKAANGEVVHINGKRAPLPRRNGRELTTPDHVYISLPWSERDGEQLT